MSIIQTKTLFKEFKMNSEKKGLLGPKKISFFAVNDLTFSLSQGKVLSILGPNGCGKTTTLRMIAGMLEPSKGTVIVDGIDVRRDKHKVKSRIGFMTNNNSLYDRLTVLETVEFFAQLNQIPADIYLSLIHI